MPVAGHKPLSAVPSLTQAGSNHMIQRGGRTDHLRDLIRAGRFSFLVAGFLLYLMGALAAIYGGAAFDLSRFLLGYLAVAAGHLSVSYSNEYFDRDSDRFGTPSPFSGGSGVLVRRPELAGAAYRLAVILIGISLGTGLIYTIIYPDSLSVFALVLTGNLLGWYYSAPPLRFVARGWGEVATILSFSIVLPGMGYLVTAGAFDLLFAVFSVPLVCYGWFFIMTVEIPDAEADRESGKMTITARCGRTCAIRVILVSALAATLWYLAVSPFREGMIIIALFSMIPLTSAVRGYVGREEASTGVTLVQENITTLVLFCLLADGFLLTAAML